MAALPPVSLAGRVVLVTGASQGVGEGIARAAGCWTTEFDSGEWLARGNPIGFGAPALAAASPCCFRLEAERHRDLTVHAREDRAPQGGSDRERST